MQELGLLGRASDVKISEKNNLPNGAKRVAVVVITFGDCILGKGDEKYGPELCGSILMQKNILESLGYKVMLIRFDELTGKNLLQKIKHLDSRLHNLLK